MRVGEVVGNYRITGKLGAGGMGAVYLARHTLIGREAAIKVLLPELCGNEAIVARFFNEAKTTTAIRHPGIVEIYDFGVADTGGAYLVMERLEGETLGRRLQRVGRLRVEHALALARQVSGALYAAHKLGVVHRDLKPDNIYIVSDPELPGGERAKILDFGIAKLRDKNGFSALQTQEGTVMGAPTYMSPEQCAGAERVDHRTDLYALGCILFEMVCGRVPFEGTAYGDVMIKQVKMPAPRPSALEPAVPPGLDELILKLMEKDPERRPKDAYEVLTRLHELSGLAAPMPVPVIPLPTPSPLEGPPTVDESALPFESQDGLAPALAARSPIYNPTMSGVVSSARRTLALGPRGKQGGVGVAAGGAGGPVDAVARAVANGGRVDMMPVPAAPPSMPTMAISQAQQGGGAGAGAGGGGGGLDAQAHVQAQAPTLYDASQGHPAGSGSMPEMAMGGAGMGGPGSMGGPGMGGPGMGGPMGPGGSHAMGGPGGPHAMGGPGPMGMPYDQGPPMQPGPMGGGTMAVGRRKGGRLGLIVVILAILAGGASAYFIATSEDFGDGDKTAESTSSGQAATGAKATAGADGEGAAAGKTGASSAGAGKASGDGAGATQAAGAAADAGTQAAAATTGDGSGSAGAGTAGAAGAAADAGEEEVLVEGDGPTDSSGPVDPETNRRPTALVTIQIDSLPRGAAVIRRVDGVKLGETPFTYETEPQGGSIALILRHKGYRDEVVNVPGNRSSERKVPLTRSRGADRAPDIHDPNFAPDPNGRWPRRGVPE